MFNVFIFDLDGTLLDTLQDLANSVNYALRQHHMPEHSIDEVHSKWRDGAAEEEDTDDMLPDEAREFGIGDEDFSDFDDYDDENGENGENGEEEP